MAHYHPSPDTRDVTLLSLDGGGVKGISSLMTLQRIMEKVRDIENKASGQNDMSERLPWQYFDLGGGTSTGGLIALMLFRLKMPTSKAIDHYNKLASLVFAATVAGYEIPNWLGGNSLAHMWQWFRRLTSSSGASFSASKLEQAIDLVTEELPAKGDAKLQDAFGKSGRMFMCATVADKGETALLRSYPLPPDSIPQSETAKLIEHETITIKQACRATSAAPTYLPEITIGKVTFWDGGLLNNNPVDQVWDARYDLPQARVFDEHDKVKYVQPVVSCIVSLGTSYVSSDKHPSHTFLNILLRALGFATNTEAKHWDFMGQQHPPKRAFATRRAYT